MLRAELKVVGGKQHGSLIPLQTKKFLVGREQDCQLRPSSESVSRHHCVFTLDDFSVRLRDLGSTNGTFVNGQRVQGQAILQPGDRILIGKLEFEIVIEGAAAAVQHARVEVATGLSSDAGFLVSELAEIPETASPEQTMVGSGSTKILDQPRDVAGNETTLISAENTSLIPPVAPAALPNETMTEVELPGRPPIDAAAQTQPMPAMPTPMAPQGMPMQNPAMMSPYGMPGAMPGYPQQPTYLQAPFANYAPQYMPNPYGMQQPFMPQPGYMDPAYQQQMAYHQQLAQQAMMAQYAAQSAPAAEDEPPEVDAKAEAKANAANFPAVSLPPPEETGAKVAEAPPPPPRTEGSTAIIAAEVPNRQLAADILNKFKNRR